MSSGCCCYRKGTNFQANHNRTADRLEPDSVVVATAKVQIFKQITTTFRLCPQPDQLLLLPQRYKFSSKSQLYGVVAPEDASCCCYRKGTNFQANHNTWRRYGRRNCVVVATAKVQIFKQITTSLHCDNIFSGCCCYRKGTNFQANHNLLLNTLLALLVVVATAKVQIFKQITTVTKRWVIWVLGCCWLKNIRIIP